MGSLGSSCLNRISVLKSSLFAYLSQKHLVNKRLVWELGKLVSQSDQCTKKLIVCFSLPDRLS